MNAVALRASLAAPVPDYVEPITGWRVWRLGGHAGAIVLESLFADAVWRPGVPLTASCATGARCRWRPWRVRLNEHPAPDYDCTCGIYAVSNADDAAKYLDVRYSLGRVDHVVGRVALWGEVVEAASGWRASHAYPLELYVPADVAGGRGLRRRAYLDELAAGLDAYGVPVEFVGDPRSLTAATRERQPSS